MQAGRVDICLNWKSHLATIVSILSCSDRVNVLYWRFFCNPLTMLASFIMIFGTFVWFSAELRDFKTQISSTWHARHDGLVDHAEHSNETTSTIDFFSIWTFIESYQPLKPRKWLLIASAHHKTRLADLHFLQQKKTRLSCVTRIRIQCFAVPSGEQSESVDGFGRLGILYRDLQSKMCGALSASVKSASERQNIRGGQ